MNNKIEYELNLYDVFVIFWYFVLKLIYFKTLHLCIFKMFSVIFNLFWISPLKSLALSIFFGRKYVLLVHIPDKTSLVYKLFILKNCWVTVWFRIMQVEPWWMLVSLASLQLVHHSDFRLMTRSQKAIMSLTSRISRHTVHSAMNRFLLVFAR